MSDEGTRAQAEPQRRGQGRLGRRRFISALGAGGLGVAASLFGHATPAEASTGCCSLAYAPNTTVSACKSVGYPYTYYLWTCRLNISIKCQCCEVRRISNGMNLASAYRCFAG